MNYFEAKQADLEAHLLHVKNQIRVSSHAKKHGMALYPFQEELVSAHLEGYEINSHTYNGSSMGVGKSAIAATVANSLACYNLLVICPASLRLNWLRELSIWYDLSPHFYTILSGEDVEKLTRLSFSKRASARVKEHPSPIITSYAMLLDSRLFRYLTSRTWDMIIADEYHYCKNTNSKRTQKTVHLQNENAKRSLMLSGTPITNSALDLFPALSVLTSTTDNSRHVFTDEELSLCNDYFTFANHFTYPRRDRRGRVHFQGVKNPEELKALLRCPKKKIFFRRTIDEVLPDLPPKTYTRLDLPITLTDEIKDYLPAATKFAEVFDSASPEDVDDVVKSYFSKDKSIMHFRHLLGVLKAGSSDLHQFIEDLLTSGESVVLFAHHKAVVEILKKQFKKYKPVLYTGDTAPNEKHEAVRMFQAKETKLFIGNILAAGVGITLTAARLCVLVEYSFLSVENEQAVSRCIYKGQLVQTYNGWKKIEDVKKGELVWTHKNRLRRVTHTSKRLASPQKGDCKYHIDIIGQPKPLVVTGDHKLWLGGNDWKEAQDLTLSDYLPQPKAKGKKVLVREIKTNIDHNPYYINNRGVRARKRLSRAFPSTIKLTEEFCFLCGFYVGDGFVGTTRYLGFTGNSTTKLKHLNRVKAYMLGIFDVKHKRVDSRKYKGPSSKTLDDKYYNTLLWKQFAKWFGKGAKNKKLPDWVFDLRGKQLDAFIEGLIASDGHRRKDKTRIDYYTSSTTLAMQLIRLFSFVGKQVTYTRDKRHGCWCIGFSQNKKFNRPGIIKSIYIERTQHAKREFVYDLEVEEDHSFIVNNTVVHNCHRIGAERPITIYYPITNTAFEKKLVTAMIEKQKQISQVVE